MLQLLQNLSDGQTLTVDVPAPGPRAGSLLIQTTQSLVSAGTERMLVNFGKAGLIGKARQQPEKVRGVVNKVRAEGVLPTIRAIRAKLGQPIPLGYCNVGVVLDDGGEFLAKSSELGAKGHGFKLGDRVVSNGPHAEVVSVSSRLCAKIPDEVDDEAAAFTPLAAIALEGIDLLKVNKGDQVVVTGLGLIGQLAVQILLAQGCRVLGLDPSPDRRSLAEKQGATIIEGDPLRAVMSWTKGNGVAGVLITASTSSNEVVSQAARSCRFRGRVVLVGVVGLQLNRADFYANEISFQVSCSYGRRNHTGKGSVRNNFSRVLAHMAEGGLRIDDLVTHRYAFSEATEAYATLSDLGALGVVMRYGRDGESPGARSSTDRASGERRWSQTVQLVESQNRSEDAKKRMHVALIGTGNFATRTLLPLLHELSESPILASVVSSQGAAAWLAAKAFKGVAASTDVRALWTPDNGIDAVFLTTRHDAHAEQAIAALRAGKHVWVEKPLALTLSELESISDELRAKSHGRSGEAERKALSEERGMGSELLVKGSQASDAGGLAANLVGGSANQGTNNPEQITVPAPSVPPVLMVGFNRRFSPLALKLRDAMRSKPGPWKIVVTINAGQLPLDHWTLDPAIGGGRIVGEACHWVDLVRFLFDAPIVRVTCLRRDTNGQDGAKFELANGEGSVGVIDYRTDMPSHLPKEFIEISGNGAEAALSNWVKLTSKGLGGVRGGRFLFPSPKKGHPEALTAFLAAVEGGETPIPMDEIFEVSRWAIRMQGMQQGEHIEV